MKTGTQKPKITRKEKIMSAKPALAGITVILGGKKYQIRPLVIREAREWRQKLADIIALFPEYVNVTSDIPDKFAMAIKGLFASMPDSIADLFFIYAKGLNREEIEASATDEELIIAFLQLNETACALVRVIPAVMAGLEGGGRLRKWEGK